MAGDDTLKFNGRQIVTFVNQKGGVGKTVSVLTIGAWLARMGEKVLLIDGDPQGNLSIFFKEQLKETALENDLAALFRKLIKDGEAAGRQRYIQPRVRDNLDLLPLLHLKLREEFSDNKLADIALVFSEVVEQYKQDYDWILLDSSPSNGRLEKMLITAAEAVFVPLEMQLFSIAGLNHLLNDIRAIAKLARKNITIECLIFNKTDRRLKRTREYQELFTNFNVPVYEVHRSEKLAQAIENNYTPAEYGAASPAARDFLNIVQTKMLGSAKNG
ncbi:MAG TPA: ParA family protein [Spirochaetota bacterium]|nr:ParA family protein [Spirochaetota bacterium]